MSTGSRRLIVQRTSVGRSSRTADAGHPRASDEASLSGPSPRRNTLEVTPPEVASAPANRNLVFPSTVSRAGAERKPVREAREPEGELALRRIYPCLDREWIGAGVQLARQPTRSVGSVVRLKAALDAENVRSPVRICGTG